MVERLAGRQVGTIYFIFQKKNATSIRQGMQDVPWPFHNDVVRISRRRLLSDGVQHKYIYQLCPKMHSHPHRLQTR